MAIYFRALVGTALIMLLVGIFAMIIVYAIIAPFHPSHNVELISEGFALAGILAASVVFFRITVGMEKALAEEQTSAARCRSPNKKAPPKAELSLLRCLKPNARARPAREAR